MGHHEDQPSSVTLAGCLPQQRRPGGRAAGTVSGRASFSFKEGSESQVIACLPTARGGDLILGQVRPRGRVVGFVQLHVPAPQQARGNNHGMDTSPGGTDTCKFYPEPVGPIRPGAWLRDVQSPHSKIYIPKKVRIGCAADVAVLRRWERIHICRNLVAAHVQSGERWGRIMVHEVHMTEESAMLASSHQAKVRVVAIVGDNESPAGREVTRKRNCVSVDGGAPERQQTRQQSS